MSEDEALDAKCVLSHLGNFACHRQLDPGSDQEPSGAILLNPLALCGCVVTVPLRAILIVKCGDRLLSTSRTTGQRKRLTGVKPMDSVKGVPFMARWSRLTENISPVMQRVIATLANAGAD